ncbi:MAG: serine/threonine-protein kinase [Terracidiphilus sp.]
MSTVPTPIPTSNPVPLSSGTLYFNKYLPLRRLGSGSFGEVWLARDQALNHEYAVKVLNSGITVDQRLREAQVGHAFTHNNLVRVHQADVTTDGKVIIAMDYLPDGSITTLANPGNFLPVPAAIRVMVDVLQGLEHLHSSDFYHNDVKPENVLRGPQGQALLGDYGIVGSANGGRPVLPSSMYILHAAPETVAGNGIEARTDIFQAGLTLFRLLVGLGTLRFKFNSLGFPAYESVLAAGSLITKKDFPPFIPHSLSRVVLTSINPNPCERYQSALEMRRALEKLSFTGHWTVDSQGMLVGVDSRHTYRFEKTSLSANCFKFEAFKKNLTSGRETRISTLSLKSVSAQEAQKAEVKFIRAVTAGAAA